MPDRSKIVRRILLLLLAALLLGGVLTGAYVLRKWQRNRQALEQRATGVQAYNNGQYLDAMRHLHAYLNRYGNDIEALDLLAKARLEVVESQNGHILQAMRVLRRILELEPGHDARKKLLELYTLTGLNTEAVDLAGRILHNDPKDLDALRTMAIAQARLRNFADALTRAEQYVALDPGNLEMQTLLLDVEFQVKKNADALVARINKLREAEPGNPRWELLQACTYRYANDRENVIKWLKTATGRTPPDNEFVMILVRLLDEAQLFAESLDVLERAGDSSKNAAIQKELAWRMWERNRWDDVVRRLGALDTSTGDPDLLALRAMALYQLQRPAEGKKDVEALATREKQPTAAAWAAVLAAIHGPKAETPAHMVEICQVALEEDSDQAFFNYVLGNAYFQMGEPDLAVAHWRRAASRRPVWGMPQLQLARAQLANGQPVEALQAATAAMRLTPQSTDVAVTWALARAANLSGSRTDSADKLLDFLDEILGAKPDEERLLPLRISLLANTGKRDEASKLMQAALGGEKRLSQATLLELQTTDRKLKLGFDTACSQRIEELYGTTPELVRTRAQRLAEAGKPDEGVQLLEAQVGSSTGEENTKWRMVLAQYLDVNKNPRARAEWTALADELPENALVQRLALRSPAIQADRKVADRLIERLRALTGDRGMTWRIQRARWLILPEDASDRDITKAVALLQEVPSESAHSATARRLLATCLQRLRLVKRAIRELEALVREQPDAHDVALELAKLYQEQSDAAGARDVLTRILASPSAHADVRVRAAAMLANQGDDVPAIQGLENVDSGISAAEPGQDRDLILAKLYERKNQTDKLTPLCARLRAAPTAERVRFLASHYAAQNRTDEAERTLALLDDLELPPGIRESVRADYDTRALPPGQVSKHYRAAVDAAPDNPVMWYRLIVAHINQGQGDLAEKVAAEAANRLPDDGTLRAFRAHAADVQRLAGTSPMRPLLAALLNPNPDYRAIAAETLKAVTDAERDRKGTSAAPKKIEALAKQHPTFQPLKFLLLSTYLEAGQNDEAALLAGAVIKDFPDTPELARLAVEALARTQRWPDSIAAARLATPNPVEADLLIAEAMTRLGDKQQALQRLEPHLEQASKDPDAYPRVLLQAARTLVAAGRADEAAKMLTPTLAKSPQWRQAWMHLASQVIDDPETSAEWLHSVAATIPADAGPEYLVLGEYWHALLMRFDRPEIRQTAQKILDKAANDPAVAAQALLVQGLVAETGNGNLQRAEECYRAALKRDPKLDVALNNLAMVLVRSGGDLDEARELAERALALVPDRVNYLDTHAQILAKGGNFERAIADLRQAIAQQPEERKWQMRLEKTLREAGRTTEADALRDKIRAQFPDARTDPNPAER